MSRIITVNREFGSGGRELGKRLAENLGVAYYDKEVIRAISERSSLAESYVEQVIERHIVNYYPITVASTFAYVPHDAAGQINRSIYAAQADVVREMAEKSDCVIVGRCADYILRELGPLNIFVYADMPSKIARCRARGGGDSDLSDRELQKQIQNIDRHRARYYGAYTGHVWGDRLGYDICVNTTNADIKRLARAIAGLVGEEKE